MAGVAVLEVAGAEIQDAVEDGDEHVLRISLAWRRQSAQEGQERAMVRRMVRLMAMKMAAGTPLPETSPMTMPRRVPSILK